MNQFRFRLFVTGKDKVTKDVAAAIYKVCNKIMRGSAELEIVDVLQNKDLAKKENIRSTPMLIKDFPFPKRRISGDLSDYAMLLSNLYSGPTEH